MSDRSDSSSQSTNKPLFQNMDDKERELAPESGQVGDPDPAAAAPLSVTTPELTIAASASEAERRAADVERNEDAG